MKRCLSCSTRHESLTSTCPSCGFAPAIVDGFEAYAQLLANEEAGGFKQEYFSRLADLEEGNFWFRSRNNLIVWAIANYCKNFQSFFEIGCGTGYVLCGVAKRFPHAVLSGGEIYSAGLRLAAARLATAHFIQVDARHIPFASEFDVIGAFDVLEHIREDEEVLAQMYQALKPAGFLILTVPQHAWLWSPVDEYACHVRRYAATDLRRKVTAAGFSVVRCTSFVTTLLPAMMVSRFSKKRDAGKECDAMAELSLPAWLNTLFSKLLGAELALIRMGANLPIGGSILLVARRI